MGRLNLLSLIVKTLKFILTLIILVLYRAGNEGDFLGIGGSWDMYDTKMVDVEILGSGVIVGYLLYNLCVVISYGLTHERLANDCLMNIIGVFLWFSVGGTAIHYWHNYAFENRYHNIGMERDAGLSLGSLAIFNALLHALDAGVALKLFLDQQATTYPKARRRA